MILINQCTTWFKVYGVLLVTYTCTYLAGLPPPCPVTPTTPHAMSFPHLTTVPEFHGMLVMFVCLPCF